VANPLQEHFAEMLLDKIREDTHPSTTHMDMLESVATDRVLAEFVLHLMQKIEADPHPSIPMLQRAQRLALQFG
jgi:hypothetical protein